MQRDGFQLQTDRIVLIYIIFALTKKELVGGYTGGEGRGHFSCARDFLSREKTAPWPLWRSSPGGLNSRYSGAITVRKNRSHCPISRSLRRDNAHMQGCRCRSSHTFWLHYMHILTRTPTRTHRHEQEQEGKKKTLTSTSTGRPQPGIPALLAFRWGASRRCSPPFPPPFTPLHPSEPAAPPHTHTPPHPPPPYHQHLRGPESRCFLWQSS